MDSRQAPQAARELLQEQHDTIEQKIVDIVEQPPNSRPSAMCWCSSPQSLPAVAQDTASLPSFSSSATHVSIPCWKRQKPFATDRPRLPTVATPTW
ncbi:TPA: hypothetical protein QDZ28_000589 [Pseudomonas putida]|nr:hypothetical protein [Pseudomonas putida]